MRQGNKRYNIDQTFWTRVARLKAMKRYLRKYNNIDQTFASYVHSLNLQRKKSNIEASVD